MSSNHMIKYNISAFVMFIIGITILAINAHHKYESEPMKISGIVLTFTGLFMMTVFIAYAAYDLLIKDGKNENISIEKNYENIDFENPSFSEAIENPQISNDDFYNNNDSYIFIDYE